MVPDTNNNNNNSQRGADGTTSRNNNSSKDHVAEGKEREPIDRRHESKNHRGGGNQDGDSDMEYDSLVAARARAKLGQTSSTGVGVADTEEYMKTQRRKTFDTIPVASGSGGSSGLTGSKGNSSPNPRTAGNGTAVGALLGVLAETNAVLQVGWS